MRERAGLRACPPGFQGCIHHGGQTACPASGYSAAHAVGTLTDSRGCSACSCTGAPSADVRHRNVDLLRQQQLHGVERPPPGRRDLRPDERADGPLRDVHVHRDGDGPRVHRADHAFPDRQRTAHCGRHDLLSVVSRSCSRTNGTRSVVHRVAAARAALTWPAPAIHSRRAPGMRAAIRSACERARSRGPRAPHTTSVGTRMASMRGRMSLRWTTTASAARAVPSRGKPFDGADEPLDELAAARAACARQNMSGAICVVDERRRHPEAAPERDEDAVLDGARAVLRLGAGVEQRERLHARRVLQRHAHRRPCRPTRGPR